MLQTVVGTTSRAGGSPFVDGGGDMDRVGNCVRGRARDISLCDPLRRRSPHLLHRNRNPLLSPLHRLKGRHRPPLPPALPSLHKGRGAMEGGRRRSREREGGRRDESPLCTGGNGVWRGRHQPAWGYRNGLGVGQRVGSDKEGIGVAGKRCWLGTRARPKGRTECPILVVSFSSFSSSSFISVIWVTSVDKRVGRSVGCGRVDGARVGKERVVFGQRGGGRSRGRPLHPDRNDAYTHTHNPPHHPNPNQPHHPTKESQDKC